MAGTQKSSKKFSENARKMSGVLREQLLNWYDKHRRSLPWRAESGEIPDPYRVWLSEIMLQQTTVQAVKAYYIKFLDKWPNIHDLAAAPSEDVMANWAGLGYYARARNLHKCAKIVSDELSGIFPDTQAGLKKLPGIGDYTSAAIAAIAFNKPATVVDGNVERVMARLHNVKDPMPTSKKQLKALAHEFFDGFTERPGDLAQSLMDLGATICIPKAPRCSLCPLSKGCEAYEQGTAAELPRKLKKKPRPQKHGLVYWVENEQGKILLHKRPEKGLLGGMIALPTGEWQDVSEKPLDSEVFLEKQRFNTYVDHVFTHFDLRLHCVIAHVETSELKVGEEYFWGAPGEYISSMPSLFQKACSLFKEDAS